MYPVGIPDEHNTLITAPVESWSDWKKVLVRSPEDRNDPLYRVPWGHIEDENGEVIPPDEFEDMVESLPGGVHFCDLDGGSLFRAEVK